MFCAWLLIAFFYTAKYFNVINNYLIFKYSFFNALHGRNLYAEYAEYSDTNHYGPLFSLIMAPFALLPHSLGLFLWQICNVSLLFWAIYKLPLSSFKKNMICLLCTQELIISLKEFQTNGAIAALIILAWVMVENRKDFWVGLFIMAGFLVKIYGIIGLASFLLSNKKWQFVISGLVWGVVLFVLPMLVFSPHFIIQSYFDWFHSLAIKNAINIDPSTQYQDVSIMGMVRRIVGHKIQILPFLIGGAALYLFSCYKVYKFKDLESRLLLLSSSLLFVVLFSTGSELVTYIIAFVGITIWFFSKPSPTKFQIGIFIFAIYFGSLFPTDLFPNYIKVNYIKPYALKALPCLIIWLTIIWEMISYVPSDSDEQNPKYQDLATINALTNP